MGRFTIFNLSQYEGDPVKEDAMGCEYDTYGGGQRERREPQPLLPSSA